MDTEIATMFGLALLSVSMWTFRVAIAARGLKLASSAIAAVEAVVFALTFSHLVADLGSLGHVMGYATGVATGTAVGLVLNERTARGHTELHLVALGDRTDLVDQFHDLGWPATFSVACGPDGPVTMMWLTVSDSEVRNVSDLVRRWAPEAFWTLRRLHKATLSSPDPALCDSTHEVRRARGRRSHPDPARPTRQELVRRLARRPRPLPSHA